MNHRLVKVSFVICALLLLIYLVLQSKVPRNRPLDTRSTSTQKVADKAAASADIERDLVPSTVLLCRGVRTALVQFHAAYGTCPTGNIAEIARQLMGDNQRKIHFLDGYGITNQIGELVDDWDRPCEFNATTILLAFRQQVPMEHGAMLMIQLSRNRLRQSSAE